MSAFDRQLVHTCTIQRSTPAQNAGGELVDQWEDLATEVSCRYVVKEEKFADESKGLQVTTVTRLLLPAGTEVRTADRITDVVVEGEETIEVTDVEGGSATAIFNIEEVIPRRGAKGRAHVSLRLELID